MLFRSHVVNYDLPNVPEDYVHRIGRTGRAGASGIALSLVCSEEQKQLKDIQRLLKHSIPVKTVEGFYLERSAPAKPAPFRSQNSSNRTRRSAPAHR